jgi:tetratricopeptide (TPR) repeat protein
LSSPADALSLFLLKTAYFFNHYEFPDILDIRFVAQFIPFLRWNLVGYGGVVLLGMVGMWMAFRKRVGPALVPGLFFLGYGLSVILFFITARYRLPAVPALILFSAYGLDGLISAWRSGRRPELFKFTAAVCVLSAVVFWPVGKVDFATNYNSLGISLKKKGDHRQAEVYYRKAIEIAPEYPSPYYNLALLLDQTDRRDEAAFMYQKHDSLKRTEAASAHR